MTVTNLARFMIISICISALIGCDAVQTDQSMLEQNKQIIRQAEAAINAQDFDTLDEFYANNYIR